MIAHPVFFPARQPLTSRCLWLAAISFGLTQLVHAEPVPVAPKAETALASTLTAEFALKRDRPDEAVLRYREQALTTQSPDVIVRTLELMMAQRAYRDGLALARYWVQHQPNSIDALFYQANLALRVEDYQLAASSLDRILLANPDAELAEVLRDILPNNPASRAQLLTALQSINHRNNAPLVLLEASLMAQTNRAQDAINLLDKVIQANRSQGTGSTQRIARQAQLVQMVTLRSNLLLDQGRGAEALQTIDTQIRLQPSNRALQLLAVRILIKQDQALAALPRLDRIIQRWPQDTETLLLAGLIAIDHREYDSAVRYLSRLHQLDPQDPQSNYFLGMAYEKLGRLPEAIRVLGRVTPGEHYQEARQLQARLQVTTGQLDQALADLTRYRVEQPDQASFLYLLQAQLLRDSQQTRQARKLLDEALTSQPDRPELLYARLLLLEPNEENLRIQTLDKLLELDGDNPIYLNAYAYHIAQLGVRLEDARRFAEQANLLAPNQPAILDTLGYVALRQNKLPLAIVTLRRAYQLGPTPGSGKHLLQALIRNGQQQEANQHLLDLRERFPDITEFQQTLDQLSMLSESAKRS